MIAAVARPSGISAFFAVLLLISGLAYGGVIMFNLGPLPVYMLQGWLFGPAEHANNQLLQIGAAALGCCRAPRRARQVLETCGKRLL
jgi:hypothetical protein